MKPNPLNFRFENLRAWRLLDEQIQRLRADGYTVGEVAEKTGMNEVIVRMRIWRMTK